MRHTASLVWCKQYIPLSTFQYDCVRHAWIWFVPEKLVIFFCSIIRGWLIVVGGGLACIAINQTWGDLAVPNILSSKLSAWLWASGSLSRWRITYFKARGIAFQTVKESEEAHQSVARTSFQWVLNMINSFKHAVSIGTSSLELEMMTRL